MDLIEADKITTPSLYRMSAAAYHADCCPEPSLSSTVARIMLDQSPRHAKLAHPKLTPQPPADTPDRKQQIGTAAHKLLLGHGSEIVVIAGESYSKKEPRELRDAALAEGKAPILEADYAAVTAMVEAFGEQIAEFGQIAATFFAGDSEVVIAWQEKGGLWCRAMVDKLYVSDNRAVLFDYKATDASADPYACASRCFQMGYDFQKMFYRRGLCAVLPDLERVQSYLVTQENSAPHAVSVLELGYEAALSAEKEVWKALALWERCLRTDTWPSYPPIVAQVDLPAFIDRKRTERELNDDMIRTLDLSRFAPPAPERKSLHHELLAAG